jgi:glycosyltransferase involved in cell wall biosynthesis
VQGSELETLPQISAVMPVRDVARFVGQAVHSVLSQSLPIAELIVVDDGSEDDTVRQVELVADSRTRLLSTRPQGAGAARNLGLRHATGEWIAFIDGDDFWYPEKLKRQWETVQAEPDVDLVFTGCEYVDEAGQPLGTTVSNPGRFRFPETFLKNPIPSGSLAIVRAESANVIGGFDESLPACIDYDFLIRLSLLRDWNVLGIADVLAAYRRHGEQITARWQRMEAGWKRVREKVASLPYDNLKVLEGPANCNFYRYLSRIALENQDRDAAWQLLKKARHFSPHHWWASSDSYRILAKILLQAR